MLLKLNGRNNCCKLRRGKKGYLVIYLCSKIHNGPIIGACIQVNLKSLYVLRTLGLQKNQQNFYLLNAVKSFGLWKKNMTPKSKSIISGNIKNMEKTRNELETKSKYVCSALIMYGYETRWLNVLEQDITSSSITKHLDIHVCFRNHHAHVIQIKWLRFLMAPWQKVM